MPTKELVVLNPSITTIDIQGQKVFQVIGSGVEEREISVGATAQSEVKMRIPDEDAQLVSQQANVSFEEARATLEETKGDLAQAILMLTSRKR
jgi:nascent polypeptide-associated complex subunit alpha